MSGSDERLSRLLAMVPWVVDHPGVTAEEVCKRFNISRKQLVRDIELILVCGIAPYYPDQMIWADIDEDDVIISPVDYFARPMRLTRAEALTVLAAGRAALDIPGVEAPDALARAISKVENLLDKSSPDGAVDVALNADPRRLRDRIAKAIEGRKSIEMRYFGVASQAESSRLVDPLELFAYSGRWYLHAWCHAASEFRVFRLDGIKELEVTQDSFDPRGHPDSGVPEPGPGADAFKVRLRLAPGPMAWFGDSFQLESAVTDDDGWTTVELYAASMPWLVQLLIRIGSGAEVLEPAEVKEAVSDEAGRILEIYGVGSGE